MIITDKEKLLLIKLISKCISKDTTRESLNYINADNDFIVTTNGASLIRIKNDYILPPNIYKLHKLTKKEAVLTACEKYIIYPDCHTFFKAIKRENLIERKYNNKHLFYRQIISILKENETISYDIIDNFIDRINVFCLLDDKTIYFSNDRNEFELLICKIKNKGRAGR